MMRRSASTRRAKISNKTIDVPIHSRAINTSTRLNGIDDVSRAQVA
jgi:hypothetical protein